jgi:nickel-dependent lactate racemase
MWLPYGSSQVPVRIHDDRLVEIVRPASQHAQLNTIADAKRLLESGNFHDLAKKAATVCIGLGASSNKQLIINLANLLIQELSAIGIQESSITLLCTADAAKTGLDTITEHLAKHDPNSSVSVSVDGFRGDFSPALNSALVNADLKIVLGELKPHHIFGLSGLPDIVFPGLGSAGSVRDHLFNRKGKRASDLYAERVEIANCVQHIFAMSYVTDSELSPARISFGTVEGCLEELSPILQEICRRSIRKASDIVVMSSGGVPTDESLSRAVETFPAGVAALKRDGMLVVAAECSQGHGGGEFYEWCAEHKEPRFLESRLRHAFNYDGFKASFLVRALENHRIYLVSTVPDHYVEKTFRMRPGRTVNSALQLAQRSIGADASITVIPDATRVLPQLA